MSGALAGPIAILPGFFFFLTMVGHYPEILSETVPSVYLLNQLGSRLFLLAFQVMLLGTLVETGTALIHAFNERVAAALAERNKRMHSMMRPITAFVLLTMATILAQVGLESLIANGYRTLTYGFWLVFLIPVLTWGAFKVFTSRVA